MRFSGRLAWQVQDNALARAEAQAREACASGAGAEPFLDLTVTNPTEVGLAFPAVSEMETDAIFSRPTELRYAPDPRGLASARDALAADLDQRGTPVPVDRVILTASTSEAYSFLFKLLCDPGDIVLVPAPSYPLFDYLARLESVEPRPYRFWWSGGGWELDKASVEEALAQGDREGRRVAALVAVSPNNPTGHWLTDGERAWLGSAAARRQAALIVDEVFQDIDLRESGPPLSPGQRCAASVPQEGLTFSLGGLSKSLALPQMKVAWILAAGPPAMVTAALRGLETIADAYLSVTTASQVALPALLAAGKMRRQVLRARLLGNRAIARDILRDTAISLLPLEGGWSQVLRVPTLPAEGLATDEEWALASLARAFTLFHPGFFFDFAAGPFLVASLITEPVTWGAGLRRLRDLAFRAANPRSPT